MNISPQTLPQASTFLAPDSPYPKNPRNLDDPANNVNFPVAGWPSLAKFVAQHHELEAFPTFSDLAIKSLLYYQAELVYLRKKLHKIEYRDYRTSGDDLNSNFRDKLEFLFYARDDALESAELGQARDDPEQLPEQWILIEKMRDTLKRYNAALLQFSQVSEFTEAENWNLKLLRDCIRNVGGPHKDYTSLTGAGAYTWGDFYDDELSYKQKSLPNLFWGLITGLFGDPASEYKTKASEFQEHLIVPRKVERPDRLTLWFSYSFIPLYERLRIYLIPLWECLSTTFGWPLELWRKFRYKKHLEDPEKQPGTLSYLASNSTADYSDSGIARDYFTTYYSGAWILHMAIIVTTVAACLFPTLAISVLAFVESKRVVLGLIAAFTALFAMGLFVLQSRTSRENVFIATVAFSAVMVVFVQNQVAPH